MLNKLTFLMLLVVVVSIGSIGCVSKSKFLELEEKKINCEDRELQLAIELEEKKLNCDTLEKQLKAQLAEYETKNKDLLKENNAYKSTLDETAFEQIELNKELQEQILKLREREEKIAELQSMIDKQKATLNGLLSKIRTALINYDSSQLSVNIKNGKIYVAMSDQLLFKSGSTHVDPAGKKALEKLADILVKQKDIDILIEGHTDSVPIKSSRFDDNWDLSVIRATSIVRILADDYGVDETKLVASGRSKYHPVATNDTADGRAKNRRTEIILFPNLDALFKLLQQ